MTINSAHNGLKITGWHVVTILQYLSQRDSVPPFQGNQRLSAGKGFVLYISILSTSGTIHLDQIMNISHVILT